MGVDVTTYRARIGSFTGGRSQPCSSPERPTLDSIRSQLIFGTLPSFMKFFGVNLTSAGLCLFITKVLGVQLSSYPSAMMGVPLFKATDMFKIGYPSDVIQVLLYRIY